MKEGADGNFAAFTICNVASQPTWLIVHMSSLTLGFNLPGIEEDCCEEGYTVFMLLGHSC